MIRSPNPVMLEKAIVAIQLIGHLAESGLPIQFNGERPHPYRDSPKVGEHNDEVFGTLKANAAE